MQISRAKDWDIDVDRYIKPYIPRNFVYRLPKPLPRFLGYRVAAQPEIGNVLVAAWAFLGAFIGLVVIEAVFSTPPIHRHSPPLVIASFGAAAILEYNVIDSPLAQPRNAIVGHFLSALVGICITKLFMLNSSSGNLLCLAGALSCGIASAVMSLTKTVHPPAGATALLAAVDPQAQRLGWFLLPLVMLSTILILGTSLVINNIQRRYPMYWWTPSDLGRRNGSADIEEAPIKDLPFSKESEHSQGLKGYELRITADQVFVPQHIDLAWEERSVLEVLRNRLAETTVRMPEPVAHA